MELNNIFLITFFIINILVFILASWTLYEYVRLDKEQFRYYIIGLFFYSIAILSFFFQYIVLPPITRAESVILGYGVLLSPLFGIFFFIKGTEYLAKQENPEFVRNEVLHKIVFYLVISMVVYQLISVLLLLISESFYDLANVFALVLYAIIAFLALKLLFEYKNTLNEVLAKIIFHYILAVVFLIVGGAILVIIFMPISSDAQTITDLSYLRNSIGLVGALIIFLPFVICYKSVSKFRKLLEG